MEINSLKPTIKLNLGAGTHIIKGWTNADYIKAPGIDIVFDANKKWKIDDGTVNELYASHVLEHLDDPVHFFEEAYRVLCPLGMMTVRVPHGNNDLSMCDPTHKRLYYPGTFTGFEDNMLERTRSLQNGEQNKVRFDVVRLEVVMERKFVKKFGKFFATIIYKMFGDYLNNLSGEIVVVMQKK